MKFYPIANALKLIGGKWKIMILDNLLTKQMRFGQLKKSLNGITSQMLSKQLKEMEKDKLLIKKVLKSDAFSSEYSLTVFGRSTIPVIKSLIKWGSFNKKKITKVIDDDQDRVIDLFNEEMRFKSLQRKK
ncbi:helix-turn-helix transcriptional regulator [Candidatus Pelagibacter sp.]|jgi:DNA-binding HxlR family transcriptional regulator|nr:helix-turn-helix transcriptional regulator [Candidatus Pelagibacter sp.]MDA9665041.1 helix-turn-helix transcriptional regulator [Candidatus Pelagibacter sp.]MDA9678517.1 helix-turn-helix transcriptional regulator [Candidatus Pelagibacter sp.]MDA9957254.1 helix-turn-helix transcriptional regulator [Candidatus Pelagibacter sp.]MDB3894586.1 helix-turn-helix transcriptional regulator [Candidatus Pelagibacter sp.]|tara:strand:+ start:1432 stop:1821 length:390 start_codon:yes stop_codon:yes gene_type:complete